MIKINNKKMRAFILILFTFVFPSYYSLSLGGLVSSAIDFVPVIGNIKSAYEAISGKDMITGEELSDVERSLSFLGAIPGGNYLKNGQKFLKAAQRAQKIGKVKNAINFAKAGGRAMNKAYKAQKYIRNSIKVANAVLKQTGEQDEE